MNYGDEKMAAARTRKEEKAIAAYEAERVEKEKTLLEKLRKNIERTEKPQLFRRGEVLEMKGKKFIIARAGSEKLILKYV